ncbi:MAG: type I-E CRISPR-associated protein Cse2/CasB [Clostridia bacterium]|nr:type I-E CRISPR-associated protein Cse2/CasB [Clostridia bacterium]
MGTIDQIRAFTRLKINRLLSDQSDSSARASLANLRRGVGRAPGALPELWGEFLSEMPEELFGRGAEISRAEWAVYTALTMFAFHQQGKDRKTDSMHKEGISLGAAANRLIKNEGDDRERIARRFYPAATASDMTELSHHLRGLVSLLRSEGIQMDYVRLAADLYLFQNPDFADAVRLRWGEDFCRYKSDENNIEE